MWSLQPGTDAKKNEKGEGVVYHIDARSHAVVVAPMQLNQPSGQKKPDARVGATLTRATANTALLFGGVSVQSQDTLGDSFILTRGEDKKYSWQAVEDSANAPTPRTGHTAAANKGKIYIFGGAMKNGDVVDDAGAVFEYNVDKKVDQALGSKLRGEPSHSPRKDVLLFLERRNVYRRWMQSRRMRERHVEVYPHH